MAARFAGHIGFRKNFEIVRIRSEMLSIASESLQSCFGARLKSFCIVLIDFKNWSFLVERRSISASESINLSSFEASRALSASHGMRAQTLVVTCRAEILLFPKSNYGARHMAG